MEPKQLIEMAVAAGRKRQSPQTGFIHLCYNLHNDEPHLPIPLLENSLFALALMRTRTSENILEGKEILDRILHFQNKEPGFAEGNFPLYMHEYPVCKDRWLGTRLAVPFYWILKNFHQILGNDLKTRLEASYKKIVEHALRSHAEKPAPYPIAVKIAAAAGQPLPKDPSAWHTPQSLGAILSALQMVYPSLTDSPWQDFWQHLQNTWHPATACYIGQAVQEKEEPEPTLYDLYMGYYSGAFPQRVLRDHVMHLEAALVHPSPDKIPLGEKKFAFTANPFCIQWGDLKRMHSFVCEGGNHQVVKCEPCPEGLEIVYKLGDPIMVEDRERNREIAYYMDKHDGVDIRIAGNSATTFQIGDPITIKSGEMELTLVHEIVEGDGKFMGHVMLGNRLSQNSVKGANRFAAYDWQIFLRTINRTDPCIIKARINW